MIETISSGASPILELAKRALSRNWTKTAQTVALLITIRLVADAIFSSLSHEARFVITCLSSLVVTEIGPFLQKILSKCLIKISILGKLSLAHFLIRFGARPNHRANLNRYCFNSSDLIQDPSPLESAIKQSNFPLIKLLVEAHADLNELGPGYQTPIDYAMDQPNLEILKYLITHGANPNFVDQLGKIYLHKAIYEINSIDTVRVLLEGGANINIKSPVRSLFGRLGLAVRRGTPVDFDLATQFSITYGNTFNQTPLIVASTSPIREDIVQLLLESGADLTLKDTQGKTFLNQATTPEDKQRLEEITTEFWSKRKLEVAHLIDTHASARELAQNATKDVTGIIEDYLSNLGQGAFLDFTRLEIA